MHSVSHKRPLVRLFQAITLTALLPLAPMASAQTMFASGGSTNSALNVSNQAFGFGALVNNTTGRDNIAIGLAALNINSTGSSNVGIGYAALYSNTTGNYNTALGSSTLPFNFTGCNNTASGYQALYSNTTGFANTGTGFNTLFSNGGGNFNTAYGYEALYSNTQGNYNVANGYIALYSNTTGSYNTADGPTTLVGLTSGSWNIALGYGSGDGITTGNYNIDIANNGQAADTGAIRIGTTGIHKAAYIAGINGANGGKGVAVYVNAQGQLYTLKSSKRFKQGIKDMGDRTDKLMKLRPVTFLYKDSAEQGPHELQYGLIAEEVARVYPELVQYDKQGKPYTVYYHLLTPMLLNELQKQHRKSEQQNVEIAALKTALQRQNSELAALKQSQQQQLGALTKLTALLQSPRNRAVAQKTAFIQH